MLWWGKQVDNIGVLDLVCIELFWLWAKKPEKTRKNKKKQEITHFALCYVCNYINAVGVVFLPHAPPPPHKTERDTEKIYQY